MNPFLQFCTEKVIVEKSDGTKSRPFDCSLSSNTVRIYDESLDVDEGDVLLRELPNGKVEAYTVEEVVYSKGLHQIPPNFKLQVRKNASLRTKHSSPTTNIHISNSQGFQVGDHNTQAIIDSFGALVGKISNSNATTKEKDEAKGLIRAVLEHPLICAVLGGAVGNIAGLLK